MSAERSGRSRQLAEFGLGEEDLAAWEASGLPTHAFDDWLTDRVARRPAGSTARAVYGADDVHNFARRAILDSLALGPDDLLLEIGCGGGLLLREALAAGATGVGIDHSREMVGLASERARGARLVLADAQADALPFRDGTFTAVAMSVVFFFFDRPADVLGSCRSALSPGGRLAVYTTGPELRGTPAAPEPMASRGHFHSDDALAALARSAGFEEVSVSNDDGGQLLFAVRPG
jgi:SAM-dependent methyltransferase